MSEKIIKKKDVNYVAKLARIAISPDEAEKYQVQLERILDYIGQLKAKNTDNVPSTAHPQAVSQVWREDVAKSFERIPEVLANAPEREENFYRVKKVIE